MFVAGDPVPFVVVVVAVVVHGCDRHGPANISLFSNAPYKDEKLTGEGQGSK